MSEKFDILIIGAGPAGVSAALTACNRGKKTGVITIDDLSIDTASMHVERAGKNISLSAKSLLPQFSFLILHHVYYNSFFHHMHPTIIAICLFDMSFIAKILYTILYHQF